MTIWREALLSGCTNLLRYRKLAGGGTNFTNQDIAFLDEVAETILPATDSPGAKEAKVGTFMTVIVKDCYTQDDQKIFLDGMQKLDTPAKRRTASPSWNPRRNRDMICW